MYSPRKPRTQALSGWQFAPWGDDACLRRRPMQSEHVLGPEHAEQLVAYLRFMRRKREQCVAEVAAEFKELRESRLFEEQYTREDVEALINGLLAVVRTTMKKDLQTSTANSVLLMKQVLEQAEKSGVTLSTDLSSTEDLNLLAGVEAWEQTVQGSGAAPQLRMSALGRAPGGHRAAPPLPSLGAPVQDPKLLDELETQKQANQDLTDKFQKLQVQCTQILREKTEIASQLEGARAMNDSFSSQGYGGEDPAFLKATIASLEAEVAAARSATATPVVQQGSGVDQLMAELHAAQARIAELSEQLDDAQAELSAKLEKTKQFLSMRTMLTKKNVVIKQLRDQLKENGIAPIGDCD